MINREKIPAVLLTYDDSLDEYGQPRKSIPDKIVAIKPVPNPNPKPTISPETSEFTELGSS